MCFYEKISKREVTDRNGDIIIKSTKCKCGIFENDDVEFKGYSICCISIGSSTFEDGTFHGIKTLCCISLGTYHYNDNSSFYGLNICCIPIGVCYYGNNKDIDFSKI